MAKKKSAPIPKDAASVLEALTTVGEVCTKELGGEENFDLTVLVDRLVRLACVISGKHLYAYQEEFMRRALEAILTHDGETLTGLWARQSGKTEVVALLVSVCMAMLPSLAAQFPKDWRLNITDELGRYRGFKHGINFGIYAPILEQAEIMHERVRMTMENPNCLMVLEELGVGVVTNRGGVVSLTNKSSCLAMSASKNSKIEGHTHHVVIAEEAQDIDTMKIRKSIHPMVASTNGTIIKIGTANTQKGDFFYAIKASQRLELQIKKRYHFFYPRAVVEQYNSMYRKFILQEISRIGEGSDEFRMSYDCEWILERGMFVTDRQLMSVVCAMTQGPFSVLYPRGLPDSLRSFSLVASLDLAKELDSTVLTISAVDWSNPAFSQTVVRNYKEITLESYRKHIVAWFDFKGDNYEAQFSEIKDILLQYGSQLKKLTMDTTREVSFADRIIHDPDLLHIEVEPFVFGRPTKAEGYRTFHADIMGGRFTFPASAQVRASSEYSRFLGQMLDLVKEYQDGYLVVHHPDEQGAHDDYPDSAMLGNWGANTPARDNEIEVFDSNLTSRG